MKRNPAVEFVARTTPSLIAAMAGTEMVGYLDADAPRKMQAKQRRAVIDSLLAKQGHLGLSPGGQQELRRAVNRIARQSDADHASWASLSTVRGAVSIGLWQTAVEDAVAQGGAVLCAKENERCTHDLRGFKDEWTHFIGTLNRLDKDAAKPVADAYKAANERIQLRHRLMHADADGDDAALLKRNKPSAMVAPMLRLREAVVEATLRVAFAEADPKATNSRALFTVLRLPESLLAEVLPS